jgi:iron(III) transport system ATP-binding protein
MNAITLQGITKRFGATVAVDDVDLQIPAGCLFFLLGSSGCGKTTILRMIAGFTEPTEGRVLFGDKDVTHEAANRRNCGMVFQGYALWPHMTVRQNVAFGLDVRKINAAEKAERVEQVLRRVRMLPYAERRPNELSGGQQQRVALARALVIEPTVLLLDEPLSNLDAKLRLEMRSEIRRICTEVRMTTVYVTHDQKEALSMADMVAVMNEGRLQQTGRPRRLYERPANRFVADFLGQTNLVPAELIDCDGSEVVLHCSAGHFRSTASGEDVPPKGNVTCSIRPEALRLVSGSREVQDKKQNCFSAVHSDTVYLGDLAQHEIVVGDGLHLKVTELRPKPFLEDAVNLRVCFDPNDVTILGD